MPHRRAICVFDRDLRFVALNARCEEIFGRLSDQLIGRLHEEVYPEAVNEAPRTAMLRALRTLRPVRDVVWSVPLQAWLDVEMHPFNNQLHVIFDLVDEPRRD